MMYRVMPARLRQPDVSYCRDNVNLDVSNCQLQSHFAEPYYIQLLKKRSLSGLIIL